MTSIKQIKLQNIQSGKKNFGHFKVWTVNLTERENTEKTLCWWNDGVSKHEYNFLQEHDSWMEENQIPQISQLVFNEQTSADECYLHIKGSVYTNY